MKSTHCRCRRTDLPGWLRSMSGAALMVLLVSLVAAGVLGFSAAPVVAQGGDSGPTVAGAPGPNGEADADDLGPVNPRRLHRLVVSVSPPDTGRVIKIPDKKWYRHGEVVILKAVPAKGYLFDRWTGAQGGPVTRIVMDRNRRVVAHFVTVEVELLLDTRPWGLALEAFTLSPKPIRILPTDDGRLHAIYRRGTFVTILARDVDGHEFVRWQGDPPMDGPIVPEWIFDNPLRGYKMSRNKRLTAVYSRPLPVHARLDWDWVYQNTRVATGWQHKCVLKIAVPQPADSLTNEVRPYEVSVTAHPASQGEVRIEPTRNPFVWYIRGGKYDEQRTGNVILVVRVKSRPVPALDSTSAVLPMPGEGATLAVLKVRPLGDIDGNGEANDIDMMLMKMHLAGKETPGYSVRHFDQTGDGRVSRYDVWMLTQAIEGLPIP